jgi:hypothetical protein
LSSQKFFQKSAKNLSRLAQMAKLFLRIFAKTRRLLALNATFLTFLQNLEIFSHLAQMAEKRLRKIGNDFLEVILPLSQGK